MKINKQNKNGKEVSVVYGDNNSINVNIFNNQILMEICILELFYATGIRISELAKIKIQDIDFNEYIF